MIEILCTGSVPGSAMATMACPISWCATMRRSRGLSTRFFFSSPAIRRSIACVKSASETASAPRRVASNAASFTRLARSAREQPEPGARIEAVQFDQQLVQRLLALVVAAERAGAARPAERVELVDEDDRRRLGPRLLEEIAHARRADADEHLDEFGAGDGKERHPGFARHRARQQGLAGSGRSDEQHALRHARAEASIFLRVLQELDHFLQLGLGFVNAGDVAESHAGLVLDVDLGATFADAHEAAAEATALLHAPRQQEPDAEKNKRRQDPGKQVAEECAFLDACVFHVEARQPVGELRRHEVRYDDGLAALGFLELARDVLVRDDDLGNLLFLEVPLELAVRHDLHRLCPLPGLLHAEHREDGEDDVQDVESGLALHRLNSPLNSREMAPSSLKKYG